MNIDIDNLLLFKTLFETGSLTDTARQLGITVSKASRNLARLRQELGNELFTRTNYLMVPTARAKVLYPRVIRLLSDFADFDAPEIFDPAHLSHVFNIGGVDTGLITFVAPLLPKLSKEAPKVSINYQACTDPFSDLRSGKLDFAVTPTSAIYPGFTKKPLFEDMFVYVACGKSDPGIRHKQGEKFSEHELRSLLAAGSAPVDNVPEVGTQKPVQLWTPFFGTLPLVLCMTRSVGIMPYQAAIRLSSFINLEILGASPDAKPFTPFLIWADRQHFDPVHSWIRDFLLKGAAENAHSLQDVERLTA